MQAEQTPDADLAVLEHARQHGRHEPAQCAFEFTLCIRFIVVRDSLDGLRMRMGFARDDGNFAAVVLIYLNMCGLCQTDLLVSVTLSGVHNENALLKRLHRSSSSSVRQQEPIDVLEYLCASKDDWKMPSGWCFFLRAIFLGYGEKMYILLNINLGNGWLSEWNTALEICIQKPNLTEHEIRLINVHR